MSRHIEPERVYEIGGLPEGDPMRREAEAHAADCPSCRRALDDAASLFARLDALPPPPSPSTAALGRARLAVHAEMDAARGSTPAPSSGIARWLPAASVGVAFLLDVAVARHRDRGAPWLAIVVALAAAAGALYVAAGRRMAVGGLVAASLGVALIAAGGGIDAPMGLKCLVHEMVVSLFPLGATAWLAASHRASIGPLGFATAATAGALAGQASLHLSCRDSQASPHLLAFHFGGVILAALLGWALSRIPRLRPVSKETS